MSRLLAPSEVTAALADLPGFDRVPGQAIAARIAMPSFRAAVRLVELVADEAEAMDHHPDLDLRFSTVVARLSTHSLGGVSQLDVELAHRVSSLARQLGGKVTGPPETFELCLDSDDIGRVLPFWAAGLGYREERTPDGSIELRDPLGRGPAVWFQGTEAHRRQRGRIHVDVYVPDDLAQERVRAAVAAGGVLVTDEFAPSWWVLADPDGNELCVCTMQEQRPPEQRPHLDGVVVLGHNPANAG